MHFSTALLRNKIERYYHVLCLSSFLSKTSFSLSIQFPTSFCLLLLSNLKLFFLHNLIGVLLNAFLCREMKFSPWFRSGFVTRRWPSFHSSRHWPCLHRETNEATHQNRLAELQRRLQHFCRVRPKLKSRITQSMPLFKYHYKNKFATKTVLSVLRKQFFLIYKIFFFVSKHQHTQLGWQNMWRLCNFFVSQFFSFFLLSCLFFQLGGTNNNTTCLWWPSIYFSLRIYVL